jgi:hypothetical protein
MENLGKVKTLICLTDILIRADLMVELFGLSTATLEEEEGLFEPSKIQERTVNENAPKSSRTEKVSYRDWNHTSKC